MNFARLEKRVCADEGYSAKPYKDTLGVWTIGFGSTRWHGEKVSASTPPVELEDALLQLRADLFSACLAAENLYDDFHFLDSVRQEVLVNMAYNLGAAKLAKFKKMHAAVDTFDYATWAAEMEDSKWWHQVGKRAERLQAAVLTGEWS